MDLTLRRLTPDDLPAVEPWFRDQEMRRWLGDEAWPRMVLRLAAGSDRRFAFAASGPAGVAALADVERYSDERAAVALVVAPGSRRRGVGSALARALARRPELAGTLEFFGGVEAGNSAGARLAVHAGCAPVSSPPDADGFRYFVAPQTAILTGPAGRSRNVARARISRGSSPDA